MNAQIKIKAAKPSPDYDADGYGWAMAQADLLRQHRFSEADWENIIEEIDCVGRRERSEYESHLTRVLAHMIKWEVQPERRGMSWWLSIMNGRRDAERFLKVNPSLKPVQNAIFAEALKYARRQAIDETGVPKSRVEAVVFSYEDAISKSIPRPEGED
jgi:Domain of unknown function DUF29